VRIVLTKYFAETVFLTESASTGLLEYRFGAGDGV